MTQTRREFVGAAALALGVSAGCLGSSVSDIYLSNQTDQPASGRLEVLRQNEEITMLQRWFDLGVSGETDDQSYTDLLDGERVRVRVDVEDGPTDEHDFEDGPGTGLSIYIQPDQIEFMVGEA